MGICEWCLEAEIPDHHKYCKNCRKEAYRTKSRVACRKKRGYNKPTTESGIDPFFLVRGTITYTTGETM